MNKPLPLQRINSILIFGILVCVVLYYAKHILIPLTFSIFLAMLMVPVADKLEVKGINRLFSTVIALLIVIISAMLIIGLVSAQAYRIKEDIPRMQANSERYLKNTQAYIEKQFNISSQKQNSIFENQSKAMLKSAGSLLANLLAGFGSVLVSMAISLVFMFLFLYQRGKYERFIFQVYRGDDFDEVKNMIHQITRVAQHYLRGRLISIAILTAMYTTGLLIVGIDNAFLLSFVAALLTIVPYVGSIVGGLFPFVIALATEDSFQPALGVIVVISIVQIIDNYFIEPYVIGGEVNLSALSTILIIMIGGFIWGVAGMVLFIPMLGIVKIILDHVPSLQPYGYLIGDQKKGNQSFKIVEWLKNRRAKQQDHVGMHP